MTLSSPELYRRAREHLNAGRNAAARRMLALAAARTDDTELRARIAGSEAAVVMRQGDPESAGRLCRDALGLPGLSRETDAMLRGQLGLLALERGEFGDAIRLLDTAIEGIGDEVEHRAPMLLNRSLAHLRSGSLAASRTDLDRAAADYATAGNEVGRAMAVHNAGYAALLEGDLVHALDRMGEAQPVLASASAVNAAICDLDHAQVLRDAGLPTEAEHALSRVVRVFAAHRMQQARGEAEFHLARSLLIHDPVGAARRAAAARRTFRAVESSWWALRADALRLRTLLAVDPMQDAVTSSVRVPSPAEVERVATDLTDRGLGADATELRLAAALCRARRVGDSSGAPLRVARDAPLPVRLLAYEVRAARASARGDHAAARRHAAAGLDALTDWQASFGSLDLATSLIMHGRGLVFAGLRAAVRSRRAEVVFEWSERARHLHQQVVPLRPPPDQAVAADLAELRMIRADADSDDWLTSPRATELSERVRRHQWASTGAAGRRPRVELTQVQDELDPDTAFVAFLFDGVRMVAVAVAHGTATVVPIDAWPRVFAGLGQLRADLDVSASVRGGPMAAVVTQALDARLAELSVQLVDPVVAAIGRRRLVLTVPGVLGGIPWAMLPALRGRVFTVATSATQWLRDRARSRPSGTGVVAGPHVARGKEEVALAAAAWPHAEVLTGKAATVASVTRLAGHVGVLHVAAHGRHAADNPLFSALQLADGMLFGYDVDLVPRAPDTVVLSACEVGRSAVRWGEEAIGMTRVWLHAGSRSVIAAPAIVADDIACELLGAMHVELAAGEPPAVALAAASDRTGIVSPFHSHGAGF